MTQTSTIEALEALLTSLTERPLCKTFGCSDCELPHLRPELDVLREEYGAKEFASGLVELLEVSRGSGHPETTRLRRGFGVLSALTPDLLPRQVRAFLQLHEVAIRHREAQGDSRAPLLFSMMRILASWPDLCQEISCGQVASRHIPQALVEHLEANSTEIAGSAIGVTS